MTYSTVGHCRACGAPMLSTHAWRIGIRREGHVCKGAGDLCRKHYLRLKRHGTTEKNAAKPTTEQARTRRPGDGEVIRTREELLVEYALIRDDVRNVREAARRMGMTFAALDKALYRARKAGDSRAALPLPQLERAIDYGHHHLRSDAA